MRLILLIISLCFFMCLTQAFASSDSSITSSSETKLVSQQTSSKNSANQDNPRLCYQSQIEFPEIPDHQQSIKEPINQILAKAQAKYIGLLSGLTMPGSACSSKNYLNISYNAYEAPFGYASLRFEINSAFFMNAHPSVDFESLNYDLIGNHSLKFKDVFTDEMQALTILSNYSRKVLSERIIAGKSDEEASVLQNMINEGTAPASKNFSRWNLLDQVILITFEQAQVAPRYFGKQEVAVPFSILSAVLDPSVTQNKTEKIKQIEQMKKKSEAKK